MNKKIPYKDREPGSKTAKFLLKRMQEVRPGDNIYQLAKRIGVPRTSLYNRFYLHKDWDQSVLLMALCGDLGLTIEEAITCSRLPDAKNEILRKYEKQIYDLTKRLTAAETENQKLKKTIQKIKNSIQ